MDLFFYHPWLFPTLATLFGLIIGSFINVVIHRLPKIMEHEWRKECADCFPEYKIKPPSGEFNLSTRILIAQNAKRRFVFVTTFH